VYIHHVIYGTSDLDRASALVQKALGLVPQPGGRHAGLGTHNRLVPLDGGFLELLAIADPEEAASSELGSLVAARIAEGDGLLAYCLAVDDVEPVAARLGLELTRITRPGSVSINTGAREALTEPWLPFYTQEPDERSGSGESLTWVEVAGNTEKTRHWLGGEDSLVRFVDGAPGLTAVGIGDREFRPG
jgi:catechol 2,3-dioxygenase-like lactoylglutathione lyase family enzyme